MFILIISDIKSVYLHVYRPFVHFNSLTVSDSSIVVPSLLSLKATVDSAMLNSAVNCFDCVSRSSKQRRWTACGNRGPDTSSVWIGVSLPSMICWAVPCFAWGGGVQQQEWVPGSSGADSLSLNVEHHQGMVQVRPEWEGCQHAHQWWSLWSYSWGENWRARGHWNQSLWQRMLAYCQRWRMTEIADWWNSQGTCIVINMSTS